MRRSQIPYIIHPFGDLRTTPHILETGAKDLSPRTFSNALIIGLSAASACALLRLPAPEPSSSSPSLSLFLFTCAEAIAKVVIVTSVIEKLGKGEKEERNFTTITTAARGKVTTEAADKDGILGMARMEY